MYVGACDCVQLCAAVCYRRNINSILKQTMAQGQQGNSTEQWVASAIPATFHDHPVQSHAAKFST